MYLTMASDVEVVRARRRVMNQTHLLTDATNDLDRREEEYQPKIEELKEYITAHSLELEGSYESGGVNVKYVKGHQKVSIPKAAIDRIRKNDPDLWERLSDYIKISDVDPRVTVL